MKMSFDSSFLCNKFWVTVFRNEIIYLLKLFVINKLNQSPNLVRKKIIKIRDCLIK